MAPDPYRMKPIRPLVFVCAGASWFVALHPTRADSFEILIDPGLSFASSPYRVGNNTLNEVFPSVPIGTAIFKYASDGSVVRSHCINERPVCRHG